MSWRGAMIALCAAFGLSGGVAKAQTSGIELHNNLMPASGGMAGASLSRPQDLQSAINGNPATLRQFQGTQFSFGGAWADANYKVTQADPLPPADRRAVLAAMRQSPRISEALRRRLGDVVRGL